MIIYYGSSPGVAWAVFVRRFQFILLSKLGNKLVRNIAKRNCIVI